MNALLLSRNSPRRFERQTLTGGYSEAALQELLFQHPDLLPLDDIEPGSGQFIPVCRELRFPRNGGDVSLDLFGITPAGRPVLVECKLWRNPQARREVIAQILEYAALLRKATYSDLTARLKSRCGWSGANPLYEHARAHGCLLDEARFTDAVSRNLRHGDFYLIIAGDGIREDAAAIVEHMRDKGAQLALVEFQRWRDGEGSELIVPFIPFRTEVVRQRVLILPNDEPLRLAEDEDDEGLESEQIIDPDKGAVRQANRRFWQEFIDRARFDHPDQPAPRHGGNNWVRIPLPAPAKHMTAYRLNGRAGLFVVGEKGSDLLATLASEAEEHQKNFPYRIRTVAMEDPSKPAFSVDQPEDATDQLAWLLDASNRMVNLLRPRLSAFRKEPEPV